VLQRNVEQAAKRKKKTSFSRLFRAFPTVNGENETRVLWKLGAILWFPCLKLIFKVLAMAYKEEGLVKELNPNSHSIFRGLGHI
jgi:hypothetical protein